ncbi:MAG: class I SAM-dependent methyltransferase [Pseudomonadales bacterium]
MSSTDRDKWNARYLAGAYADREHPSLLVAKQLPDIVSTQRAASGVDAELRALDLACGAGRNALYLAGFGYRVDAVDISAEALARGETRARKQGLTVSWVEHDLDLGLPRSLGAYDLIVIIRYFDLSLVAAAAERLQPGGYLICEAHLATQEAVIGPRDPSFRAKPGELHAATGALDTVKYWEGLTLDPDGRVAALARLVAWKPLDRR